MKRQQILMTIALIAMLALFVMISFVLMSSSPALGAGSIANTLGLSRLFIMPLLLIVLLVGFAIFVFRKS